MKIGIRELLFFFVMLGAIGSVYVFGFSRANDKRLKTEAETVSMQRDLDILKATTSGIEDRNRKLKELEAAIQFFDGKLPAAREVDTILQQISQISQADGLTTKTVRPSKGEATAHYSEEPIVLVLNGSFEGFYQFLIDLEKLPRLTRVTQMKLSKISDTKGQMTANMTLSIYYVPDPNGNNSNSAASGR
jgi:Tfp pilus assembly protein PilO